ncbi:antibiotic biosynthesis monooxygenase family protein [Desulfospira joergensenii]|uniref:antibiotic biosynthesis monooxygenase family protein n=1 Tax=Desulfospira joergensenii TaxID=53329 RepID=UPI0003B75930|nr:antibiotic biosynthesis monooxygenase family protein [Desulfospira joergensenii]
MAVTVLIKRKVIDGKGELLENLYQELIALAVKQEGYLGAETFRRMDIKDEYLVISRWRDVEDWSKWLVSEGRRAFQERIDALTDTNTKFEIYESAQ